MSKNICMAYWYYLPQLGGIESLMHSLGKELVSRDYNLRILTGPCEGGFSEHNGIKVDRTQHLSRNSPTDDKELYSFLKKYLKEKNIDVLHLHNFQRPHAPNHTSAFYFAAKGLDIPVILHAHHKPKVPEERLLLNNFNWDRVVTVSKWVGNGVLEYGLSHRKIDILHNCVDTDVFKPGLPDEKLKKRFGLKDEKLILCPTRLVNSQGIEAKRKRYMPLLKAASMLSPDVGDFKLLITAIENPNYKEKCRKVREKIKQRASIFGISDKIILPKEKIEQDDMPALYSMADLMVMPSIDEAFGIVFIEAMSSGTPVIGTTSGAVPEVISHKKTGRLVSPESVFDLSRAMELILSDKKTHKKYAENGRQHVLEKFSTKKVTSDLEKIYNSV